MPDLIDITNLKTCFRTPAGVVTPVNGISFTIKKGKTLALVGESGSGKSMTALSIMRLLPPTAFIQSGSIRMDNTDIVSLSEKQMRAIRGNRISMVFQEPMTSLNPVLSIGDQITESLPPSHGRSRRQAREEAAELLRRVGIQAAGERLNDYPHQLSGGMRQRVMIAMALARKPELLIADEPTTALDVTVQAQILELIDSIKQATNMGILLITHDLGIVSERSDHTCVMYTGQIVESAASAELLQAPRHPYTRALLASLPQNTEPGKPLATLAGQPPSLSKEHKGCAFYDRCPEARAECADNAPELSEISPGRFLRCWRRS